MMRNKKLFYGILVVVLVAGVSTFLYLNKPLSIADNIYNCNEDNDRVSVKSGCCGCNGGGSNTAINRKYIEYWYDKLSNECREIDCGDIMSNHWTCFAKPKCVDGKCQLLPTVEKISMWQNGEELISDPRISKHNLRVNIIMKTLHKLNLQATCVFSEEDIQEIKQKDRVVEIIFKQAYDFPIRQWIEPYRSNAKSDERGYRILENVKTVLFILEDNLDEGLEAPILVGTEREDGDERCSWERTQEDMEKLGPCEGIVGYVFSEEHGCIAVSGCKYRHIEDIVPFNSKEECELACGRIMWSCWAIQQEGSNELDKSWINEIRFKGG